MDLNTNAYRIVKALTEEKKDVKGKSASARMAGLAGGKARAAKLSEQRRHEIALRASQSRWKSKGNASAG